MTGGAIDLNIKRKKTIAFYLPDECWESVFKFLNVVDDDGNNQRNLEPLSLISKQFLSITNRLIFSLTVSDPAHPPLRHLFHRFTSLASLDLSHYKGDLNKLINKISCFPLKLTSLNLSNHLTIPTNGLQAFSQNITTLTSLTCSHMGNLRSSDLTLIADCFPLLEELDLSKPSVLLIYPIIYPNRMLNGIETLSLSLAKLRKVNLTFHIYMNDQSLLNLFKNLKHLEEAIILRCDEITNAGVASALRERPTLRSLSFTTMDENNVRILIL
ncbi:uncharacterized protein [Medicago truncatula]|uniref:RNI superfamily protein, putative n=1 Tax=Medicago truncatula TaxID=3880 RepID=G7L7R2_MEDTR|nr:uncharacterized protein LOC11407227 [Medicago truncatula]AET02653.1 RNI superfamily protein, putative [Medicago truncatula]